MTDDSQAAADPATQPPAPAPARFDTLPLDAKLIRAVADQGYAFMTPIQAKAILLVLEGRDVMGAAQTAPARPPRSRSRCCRR